MGPRWRNPQHPTRSHRIGIPRSAVQSACRSAAPLPPRQLMNFIAGEWCDAADGATYERANPARVADVIGAYPESGRADAERAVKAAWNAFEEWRNAPAAT